MLENAINLEEGKRLLALARASIQSAVLGSPRPAVGETELTPGLVVPLGAFVTLYKRGDLRGCIGRMEYDRPLYRNVMAHPL